MLMLLACINEHLGWVQHHGSKGNDLSTYSTGGFNHAGLAPWGGEQWSAAHWLVHRSDDPSSAWTTQPAIFETTSFARDLGFWKNQKINPWTNDKVDSFPTLVANENVTDWLARRETFSFSYRHFEEYWERSQATQICPWFPSKSSPHTQSSTLVKFYFFFCSTREILGSGDVRVMSGVHSTDWKESLVDTRAAVKGIQWWTFLNFLLSLKLFGFTFNMQINLKISLKHF